MNNNLLFNFTADKENSIINIRREFNADRELVWEAWTNPEILDQWWAPKPYHTETKSLDLRVNGMWLYAMVSPKDDKIWCKADYKTIETNKLLSWSDAFCDENGNENNAKPRSLWTNYFTENNNITIVDISLKHDKLEDIETMIKMGFKDGIKMAFGNLDEIFFDIQKVNQ
jgi:uncharacterized protein YndB with AHSA1/START domain